MWNWTRRSEILAGFAVALTALGAGTSCAPPASSPAARSLADCNVVLISLDTLRGDRLGAYGHARSPSPALDRFARRSVVFEDALAQCSTTAPSHRSLFTSHYVYEHRNEQDKLPMMAEILRDAGWRTGAFVDGGQLANGFGFQRGFETYQQSGSFHAEGAFIGGGLHKLVPMATNWVRENRDDRFFLFLHTYDIHCPYTPPEPFLRMYAGPEEFPFDVQGRCGQRYFNKLRLEDDGFRLIEDLYDGGIRYTDRALQSVFRTLEEEGLDENTIVIVTSDHGESLGERRHVGHNQVREVQLRVPLMFYVPGAEPASLSAPVQLIDVLPTLLSLLELDFSGSLSGEDLAEAVTGENRDLPQERFRLAETGKIHYKTMRRDRRWSLEINPHGQPMLYDLWNDPTESRNLRFEQRELFAEMYTAFVDREIPTDEIIEMPTNLDQTTIEELQALGYFD